MWSALDKNGSICWLSNENEGLKDKLDEMYDHFAYILKNHGAEEAKMNQHSSIWKWSILIFKADRR